LLVIIQIVMFVVHNGTMIMNFLKTPFFLFVVVCA
jgi:hypothetical protein